jgi:ribonuclease III family protein
MEKYKPLVMAFIGDAHYNLYVKRKLIDRYQQVNDLQKAVSQLCSGRFQAKVMKYLLDNDLLSEEEIETFKRARNHKSHGAPKNTDVVTYKVSTGFEALWGSWYLNEQEDRLGKTWDIIETIME